MLKLIHDVVCLLRQMDRVGMQAFYKVIHHYTAAFGGMVCQVQHYRCSDLQVLRVQGLHGHAELAEERFVLVVEFGYL
jgi:hypothetical protein